MLSQQTQQMSASLQSFEAKLLEKERAYAQDLEEIRELEKLCERQQQNLSEILTNTEQVTHRLDTELKKKEALAVKLVSCP